MSEIKYGVYENIKSRFVYFSQSGELPQMLGIGDRLVSQHLTMDEAKRAAGLLDNQALA